MEQWETLAKKYRSEEEARKAGAIVAITESRLSSQRRGLSYEVETEVFSVEDGWQVRWRKVPAGYDAGCGGCGSCQQGDMPTESAKTPGKVIPFVRKAKS